MPSTHLLGSGPYSEQLTPGSDSALQQQSVSKIMHNAQNSAPHAQVEVHSSQCCPASKDYCCNQSESTAGQDCCKALTKSDDTVQWGKTCRKASACSQVHPRQQHVERWNKHTKAAHTDHVSHAGCATTDTSHHQDVNCHVSHGSQVIPLFQKTPA